MPTKPYVVYTVHNRSRETTRKGQAGDMVIGNKKIWTLAYADDIVPLAKEEAET